MIEKIEKLNEVLAGYNIKAKCIQHSKSNHFNIFDISMNPGCKIRSLENIASEIQVNMNFWSKPIIVQAPELGILKMIVAEQSSRISLNALISGFSFNNSNFVIGIAADGKILSIDFDNTPHILVAGSTGSGKSVFLHQLIANFILTSRDVEFHLIDPKIVEFESYKKVTGTRIFVYNSYTAALSALRVLDKVMELRYAKIAEAGCRNINEYNKNAQQKMKRLICVIDELADLMIRDKETKELEKIICHLAAKARAAGIHLILATQRPSVDVITGLIKANFPVRIAFRVSSSVDSRVILDRNGAEALTGNGDGILLSSENKAVRFQSAFIDPSYIDDLTAKEA